ncbi:hypothetical protein PV10_00127 [Exophiala mesophila]|uniref:Tetrapyrrole biosynthesis uroporphyrinogen III synthase domain-containing protein n=1 Tax=Exophiala mesophila TaxID=212818 RepID=A0A0D1ZNK3_EXOME|nr:uncharacterized protein PV10_00127 [Exophiala mesophila]KIV96237.1 hypothetical protein PV10_00127 [Exophiala mesophila]
MALSDQPSTSDLPLPTALPVLFLKTRSQPHDAYEEYFSTLGAFSIPDANSTPSELSTPAFLPLFLPVLEHHPNVANLEALKHLLRSRNLHCAYGGIIFTSQRAVEAWSQVVNSVDVPHSHESRGAESGDPSTLLVPSAPHRAEVGLRPQSHSSIIASNTDNDDSTHSQCPSNPSTTPTELLDDDFNFPLYSVGPATSRALNTLISESSLNPTSSFAHLRPLVVGDHSGNGANLAQYILSHYNSLHATKLYTFYDAPRLPFTPLLGPSSGDRVQALDQRLRKKGLLFLVGEQRRDVIPKTLADPDSKLHPNQRIKVDELEVYSTGIMPSFPQQFASKIHDLTDSSLGTSLIIIVVFSPQGCEAMLTSLGFLDHQGRLTEKATTRWTTNSAQKVDGPNFVIVTIGPTTRDYLKDTFGFDADACASKPTPQGVGEAIRAFLSDRGLV